MPDVPTFGKNEQSLAGTSGPRTGPGPQGGWRCSSFEPEIRRAGLIGLTAIVGSFCLLVGNTAVVFDVGSPCTCGLLACTSMADAALATLTATSESANAPVAINLWLEEKIRILLLLSCGGPRLCHQGRCN